MVSKILQTSMQATQRATITQPFSVCMYVRGVARTDNRVMREATALAQAGFAVSVIDLEADWSLPVEEEIQGVCVKHIVMPSWYAPARFKPWFLVKLSHLFLRSVFRLIQVKADIYHAHDDSALLPCFVAARLCHKPLIFDAHELPLFQSASELSLQRRLLRTLLAGLFPYIISRCAAVITVSPPIVQSIQRRYRVSRVELVRNIPPLQEVPKSEELRQYLGLTPDARVVLYQGNLHAERELYKLILAAKFLEPNSVIVMMGKGSIETTAQLQSLIASEGVADRVKLIPPVPYEHLLEWTASADIGVILYSPDHSPNIRMCLPNKLFEYLMAGVPVLSSQLDAITEVIKTYDVGQVISSLTPLDIAKAINTLLAERFALAKMHTNALQASRDRLRWEKESQALVELYQDILAPQPVNVCMHILREARTDVRVMREATALAEAGFAVSIIDIGYDPALPPTEVVQGINFSHIIMPSWNVPTRFKPWFLAKLVFMIIIGTIRVSSTRAAIYHAYNESALPACYVAACLCRKLLIFDAMELPLSDPTVARWQKLAALSRYLLSRMIPRCASVIAVSPPIIEEMHRQYYGVKATLIRNVPPYCIVPKSEKLRHYLGLDQDTRIALYQGNIQSDRGLSLVVRAASFLNQNIVVVIMGKGPEVITAQLQSLITSEGVADRVKLIPSVPYEHLLEWTASADIGLTLFSPDYSLSIRWCLPNKLFEYLMAGLPVLSSPLDAVAEVIKTYEVGQIVPSLEPATIATAITKMMADRSMLHQMRSNALRAAQKFCWEEERQHLICLYQSLFAKGGEE
jgi:glycosyltransferase involved in cell wall biosynthesis